VSLRILTVTPYFQPAWAYGGIPRLAYGLSRALSERGHSVAVVTTDALDRDGRLPAGRFEIDGLDVQRLANVSNHLAYDHQLFLPRGAAAVLDAAVAEADVVHLHGYWHLLNNYAVVAARRHDVPVVMTPNGTLLPLERKLHIKGLWQRFLGTKVMAGVDRWIAVSRAEINQFARAGIAADRIHLVHNGLDLGEFEALPERGAFRAAEGLSEGPLLLYLGKLTPRKGVDHLIAAMAQLQRRDAQLVVAGNDMGVRAELEAQVADLQLQERVRFVGLVTGERRVAALADADLLVYPSSDEIFGLVPFEGLLAGTPAVVSDDCGCGELVAQARAGELVRFAAPAALARALDSLLGDDDRRRRMVSRGRAFIGKHFAWPRIAIQTESVYKAAQRC
jgi:glycosyltransferase involved in cell wall biosynthesis